MSVRCVVIDDEKPARDRLKRMLARHPEFELVGEASDAGAAVKLIDGERPDLCFLDVRMPEGDGFEVLSRVGHVPHVIFTTAFDEYAVSAFEVNSVDYLLKPFSPRRLGAALERAQARIRDQDSSSGEVLGLLEEVRAKLAAGSAAPAAAAEPESTRPPERIPGRHGTRIVLLAPADVLWFEAEDTLVFARTSRGRFLIERTIADLERQLGRLFFRTHRRVLVNLSWIAEILPGAASSYRVVLRDEARSEIPLSRRQARRLRELFQW